KQSDARDTVLSGPACLDAAVPSPRRRTSWRPQSPLARVSTRGSPPLLPRFRLPTGTPRRPCASGSPSPSGRATIALPVMMPNVEPADESRVGRGAWLRRMAGDHTGSPLRLSGECRAVDLATFRALLGMDG